jgi:cellulose synthase/poly-beta-1,6-N-acetylglucosamine synthase-like glycosyltransferase
MAMIDIHIVLPWVYFSVILFILIVVMIFCFTEFALGINYIRAKRRLNGGDEVVPDLLEQLPVVTIQIPIYNEKYVAERAIRSCYDLLYPKEKLQIQILDDSTDETIHISNKIAAEMLAAGYNITVLHRTNRDGFKAGALRDAMATVVGDFIAIFDADFLIPTEFLQDTLPYFKDEKIGMVQTRWGHLNESFSLLTKIQSFFIDLHFSVQHTGRNAFGYFINFNGTAGIWRKSCIIDAGGWTPDTLTEDLDLSYRAQMRQWKFKYREGKPSLSELPAHMSGIKSQQFRWIKGGTQVGLKLFSELWHSNATFKQKWFGFAHIFSGMTYIFSFALFILSVPLIVVFKTTFIGQYVPYLSIFMFSTLAILFVGGISFFNTKHDIEYKSLTFIWRFMMFLFFTMGLSFNNTLAIMEGLSGKKSDFIRTPKFNLSGRSSINDWAGFSYLSNGLSGQILIEILLLLYFLFGIGLGIYLQFYHLLPLHVMLVLGYGMIVYYSIKHTLNRL